MDGNSEGKSGEKSEGSEGQRHVSCGRNGPLEGWMGKGVCMCGEGKTRFHIREAATPCMVGLMSLPPSMVGLMSLPLEECGCTM